MIQLNYRDPRPIYEQVVDGIERLVLCGALAADSQLPSVRQLALELSINPNTMQRAYGELEKRGIIYSARGKGNFVAGDIARLRCEKLEGLREKMQHLADEARGLGASEQQLCEWVQKRRDSDD